MLYKIATLLLAGQASGFMVGVPAGAALRTASPIMGDRVLLTKSDGLDYADFRHGRGDTAGIGGNRDLGGNGDTMVTQSVQGVVVSSRPLASASAPSEDAAKAAWLAKQEGAGIPAGAAARAGTYIAGADRNAIEARPDSTAADEFRHGKGRMDLAQSHVNCLGGI